MDFNTHTNQISTASSLGTLMPMAGGGVTLPLAASSASMDGSMMETVTGSLTTTVPSLPALVRRPSKKEREAEKRSRFYLSPGQGSNNPRYVDWANRFVQNYLEKFNTDSLVLFYGPSSTFTFLNTLITPSEVVCHQGEESIYTYLQIFRSLKQIHLGQNGIQIQPMTDNHSIAVTLEINIEPAEGQMCHVITTFILQTLPGKKTRRQIGEYQACQFIQNQFFSIVV